MSIAWIVTLCFFALWLLATVKTSRPDGHLVKVHPYRQLMFHIMPTRTEAAVYGDRFIDAENLLKYVEEASQHFECKITHCLVAACAIGLANNPRMNRFVKGRRLYQRRGRWVTFTIKRKKLDSASKLSVVKLEIPDGQTFPELCARIDGRIGVERSNKKTSLDKELALLSWLPNFVLTGVVRFARWLDEHNLLPGWFIRGDGMFTSVFVANLGSLGMLPAYHHLYEWGNCAVFITAGKIEDRPVVSNGEVTVRPILNLRWGFDERVDDGLTARIGLDRTAAVLEDPYHYLGTPWKDATCTPPLDMQYRDNPAG